LQLAIIENVQRADLNALEEAQGYRALIDEFNNSQEDIAKIVGKSRSYVANTLRLLKLSDTVKAYIHGGKLTAGHARMLIGEPNADALAEEIIARELNVREVEAMARERAQKDGSKQGKGRARAAAAKDADVLAFEKRVSDATGLVVSIDHRKDRGTLTIRYNDLEQLDDLVQRLVRGH
jgi:ParB family chromosome partitioning protein